MIKKNLLEKESRKSQEKIRHAAQRGIIEVIKRIGYGRLKKRTATELSK